jgi:hypothetical protein
MLLLQGKPGAGRLEQMVAECHTVFFLSVSGNVRGPDPKALANHPSISIYNFFRIVRVYSRFCSRRQPHCRHPHSIIQAFSMSITYQAVWKQERFGSLSPPHFQR